MLPLAGHYSMDAFAFGYKVEWPVSLVLNHKALAQYQMLFRHFFYCKHIEWLLSAVGSFAQRKKLNLI